MLSDPQVGFNADVSYQPGPSIELRDWETDALLLAVEPVSWNNGEIHSQSGDRGWLVDFSEVTTPGTYYLVDPTNEVSTGPFEIAADVYDDVLVAADNDPDGDEGEALLEALDHAESGVTGVMHTENYFV